MQVIDDMLDFKSSSVEMGKPTATDLQLGLATAPVLYAAEEVRTSTQELPAKKNLPVSEKSSLL